MSYFSIRTSQFKLLQAFFFLLSFVNSTLQNNTIEELVVVHLRKNHKSHQHLENYALPFSHTVSETESNYYSLKMVKMIQNN
ncbi:homeobox-leucine zipper protein ATHB-6 [Trifolium repens]|nr:homeobox-leucine zipper protein ATHB-6 [Trifolium repens]